MPQTDPARRAEIHAFVVAFYDRVRAHKDLGPIFNERLDGHWAVHFKRLTDFWVTILLGTPAYKGNPFEVHQMLPDLTPELFTEWLTLFEQTAPEMLSPALAEKAVERAHRIADSLQQGLFFRPQAS
ncbi:group III truncated hemoglobin [Kordiimonas marina]|uniref:group III truncated hemoglobin n=1 Tax=Kordiimonas marina TaxID=2872312 RepID=UPI001FF1627C|nr:group III truncated hemoglobin [Kordiimonas marina]MCJ9428242.1 group III truncated hemoglobin [Kordiimonas marina]